jgi:GDPmannose 4,6-dehydratase
MKKKALITGITGQDGSYLADFLLKKNYEVHGVKRKSSSFNTQRIDHIYKDPHNKSNFFLHYGDLTDSNSLLKIISQIKPDEIYNLGAQSHVGVSFENPEYTAQVTGMGALRILEVLRFLNLKKTKFYQAGSSELFGEINKKKKFNEKSEFHPKSPYGASKLFAHQITKIYRDSYKIFACNGILFNHESPRRGETFVTRKITRFLTRWIYNLEKILYLGNIYAIRDWGHAKDYVEMQWKIMQQKKPEDYIISTGTICTVKEFFIKCCELLNIKIYWSGKGPNEYAYTIKHNKKIILMKVDKDYFRPLEVNYLKGDSAKAFKNLNFKPKYNLKSLISDMIESDLIFAKKESASKQIVL